MKTHDNRVLFSKALLKAATCLFLTAGAGMSPVFALPGTAESMKMEITQQTVTVSGVVKDKKGEPIIGANIMEKGTTNGTITDFDGKYTLKVKSAQSVLTISYIGYKTQEIPVGNGGKKDITLQDDSELMDEVVVIGYGTQRKGDVTSAVASVKAEDFTAGKIGDAAELIKGKVAGLTIAKGSGDPNAESTIRLRGVISLQGGSTPLVLVDGIEGGLGTVSPENIASIDVLKDASAAAIYGTRGANGVILITTKRGQASSKVKISYSGSYTLQTPGIVPDYVDGYNWALMKNEVSTGTFSPEALQKLQDGSDPDHYANTNWLDAVLRNASMHQHHLSVSGGNENTRFMTSVAYSNQDGIMMKTGVERFSFRSNIDTRYKRFTFGLNLSGNKNNVTTPVVAPSGEGGIMRYVSWFTRPTVPVMYSDTTAM